MCLVKPSSRFVAMTHFKEVLVKHGEVTSVHPAEFGIKKYWEHTGKREGKKRTITISDQS
jgi:hypothetical protein